ncbi:MULTISPECIES: endolytic transglycosylase MltG [unclassified Adlercreutzia]|uniref:endolytic transglycosylase MltG n=1 Tax=unclassified Adlercreutzia TaxID=2636013 RepID=UPI0013EDF8D8|nr:MULTISPECIES: endolytic transglycosylase MltG [unclassified Adlercreutzia]
MPLRQKQVPISSTNSRAARSAHARARQEFKTYDTSAIQPKKSKLPYVFLVIILVVVALAVALVIFGCQPKPEGSLPADQQAIITVEPGQSATEVADSLVDAGLIGDAGAFLNLLKEQDAAASLIPGDYVFNGKTSMEDIIEALVVGPTATGDTLTVPEGYTRQAIAQAVQEATGGRITYESFLEASRVASWYVEEFPFLADAGDNNLEGFLFPKTYTITATDDAESLVRTMLRQYETDTAAIDWTYPESQGLNHYEALILASIVEKESAPDNRATVASVFYNRLASERPYLESDATTAYEVGHDPSGEEVHADTPYSTYSNPGLPPTPICNPSLEALQAICNPEQTDYMYFYSDENGYTFSVSYEDHQKTYS